MPSINVAEADFRAVADAARRAQKSGNFEAAKTLDKLARKINAALSSKAVDTALGPMKAYHRSTITWRDMPSVLRAAEEADNV